MSRPCLACQFAFRFALALIVAAVSAGHPAAAEPREAAFAWMEGEAPSSANVKFQAAGWGHKEFLSGEKWLQVSIDPDKLDKELPAGGGLLDYRFRVPASGKYEVWDRIGYEFVRSPFDWRVDGGAWTRIVPEQLTVDLMDLQDWNEVAWLKLGTQTLTPGEHRLSIRLPRTLDDKGKPAHVLYASDALCVHLGAWTPYSHFKPGEDWRDTRDREAAKKIFEAPRAVGGRGELNLSGLWEVCRDDEQSPGEVAAPIKDFPADPYWKAIAVPSDKMQTPELVMAHRLWYRTKLSVPAGDVGHSFRIEFPQNNLNTTIVVNGVYCGFDKNPYARFDIDITKAIKPGINEIRVGIKDAYYGYSANPKEPMKLRRRFNLPLSFSHQGFQDLAYPVWNAFQSGILVAPRLIVGGPVYAAEVFIKPSVARKELTADVTLTNTTSRSVSGSVESIARAAGAAPAGAGWSATRSFTLAPGETRTVSVTKPWPSPTLWWPDRPALYDLTTSVKVTGATGDVSSDRFGFREWSIEGIHFKLNGVNYHAYGDAHGEGSPDDWLAFHRKTHQHAMRFWGTDWKGMPPEEALSWFDKNGVVVRRQGMLDGEAIGYMAIETDPVLKALNNSEVKMDLMRNWKDQMVAQVIGERNHPSIMIWSIENEWLYINCINLYGGLMDQFEAEVTRVSDAVRQADPTRSTMTDGGGATRAQTMPVHGNHYVAGAMQLYPDLAYRDNPEGGGRGRWVWDEKRPRFLGEDFFFAGNHPELSAIGGEAAFAGKQAQLPASSLMQRILHEGYRWADFGGWDLYVQPSDGDGSQYNSLSPRAVLCRQWDWTFGAGQQVKRSLAIFNDTHYADPMAFTWTLTVAGQRVAGETTEHSVPPGENQKLEITLPLPQATARKEGLLTLTLSVKGQEVFRDTKAVSILPNEAPGRTGVSARLEGRPFLPVSVRHEGPAYQDAGKASLPSGKLALFDPAGSVAAYLQRHGVPFTALTTLTTLPDRAKVLVIGKDALSVTDSASSRLAAYAAGGRAVIVLEQRNPLKYQALPAQMETEANEGRAAFAEDLTHPVLRGIEQKDLFAWSPDEVVYKNAYRKPETGGRSLIQCDSMLHCSALVEIPAGQGVLLLSQLMLEAKLPANAVAQKLLANMIEYGEGYKLTHRQVATTLTAGSAVAKAVDAIGLTYSRASDPLQSISQPGAIALVDASPANLKSLAANEDRVKAFTEGGGWIVFNGLTPDGLEDYNKIVGFDHMIRPFKRERVTFPPVRSPLTAGIPTGDVVMYSPQRIFNFQEGNYVVSDEFSYVVDIDDVAPFGKSPFFAYDNIVNNFVSADGWPLIINFPINKDNSPFDVPITLPKPQTITEFTWVGNVLYYPQTRVNLIFDRPDGTKDKVEFKVEPNAEPQTFRIDPPRTAQHLTLQIADWMVKPNVTSNIGIDNIYLRAQRPPDFTARVRPMLNVGGMVEYPRGQGGIVLCNLNFKETEEAPENAIKKRNIMAAILRNLKAPFSSGASVIAGANLNYSPIDISKQANAYRDERGWFGDKRFTFKDLPTGEHTFAGVRYNVYDFPTSPVPTVVMLAGNGVPGVSQQEVKGIPVNRKASALFFLMAARIDARRSPDEIKRGKRYEMARYVVHYADGQTANIPIYAEEDVEDYHQKTQTPIPGAQIAWTGAYAGTDETAVAYSKQWNNPRPSEPIQSIDLVYGPDRRGVPALLALTAATHE